MRATCFSFISSLEQLTMDTNHKFTQHTAYVLNLHVTSTLLAPNFIFFNLKTAFRRLDSVSVFWWNRSRSHITTGGQSASSSWCPAPLGAGDQMLHLFE
jgi:hypothetical protein